MRTLLLCFVALLLTAGCVGTSSSATSDAVNAAGARVAPPVGKWLLTAFGDRDGAVPGEVTLNVEDDGAIAGSGGCNGYFGRWSLGEAQSTLGPVGATRRMCAPEVMDVEMRYFEALSRVAGWRATDAGIVLTDASGDPLLAFRAR